jgi:hypothetical protein
MKRTMTNHAIEFHLSVDRVINNSDSRELCERGARDDLLRIPLGISHLTGLAQFRPALAVNQTAIPESILLEPMLNVRPPLLVVLAPQDRPLRVNGQRAPSLVTLVERDQFQPDDMHVLHVMIYRRALIGRATGDQIGTTCGICLTPISADARVYTCGTCGVALHQELRGNGDSEPLECSAAVSACPACETPIVVSEGYNWKPERYDG